MSLKEKVDHARIKPGVKVTFNPFYGVKTLGLGGVSDEVTGVVIEIYKDRRWFAVEYELGDQKLRSSFNFVDLGDKVFIKE